MYDSSSIAALDWWNEQDVGRKGDSLRHRTAELSTFGRGVFRAADTRLSGLHCAKKNTKNNPIATLYLHATVETIPDYREIFPRGIVSLGDSIVQ